MKARSYFSKIHIGSLFSRSLPILYVPVGSIVRAYSTNLDNQCIAELKGSSERVKLIEEVVISDKLHLLIASSYELILFKVILDESQDEQGSTDAAEDAIHFKKVAAYKFPWKVSRFALSCSNQLYIARKNSKQITRHSLVQQQTEDFFEFQIKLKRLKTMKIAEIEEQEYLLVSNQQTVSFVSLKTAEQVLEIKVPMGIISDFSSKDNKVAYSDTFGKIRVAQLKKDKNSCQLEIISTQTLLWHAHSVKVLKFNSINYLYSGGQEGVIVAWHLVSGEKNFIAHLGYRIFDLCIHPDNSLLAVVLENNKMFVLDVQNYKPQLLFQTIAPLRRPISAKLALQSDYKSKCLIVPQIGGWMQFVDINRSDDVVSKVFDLNISGRNYVSKLEHSDPDPFVEVRYFCSVGDKYLVTMEEIRLESKVQKVKIWKRVSPKEFQLMSVFQNSLTSFLEEQIQAVISPQKMKSAHFLEVKETQFNIWCCAADDERAWTSERFGQFRKKRITAYEYSQFCKGGDEGQEFLVIAFETALTSWNVSYPQEGRVSYSLNSSFSLPRIEGQVEELSLSGNNRYLAVRKKAGLVTVYRFSNMEVLWEQSLPDSEILLKGGFNRFALFDTPSSALKIFDYTSKVPIQTKTIKRKVSTQPQDPLVMAGFYEGVSILLIYESGAIIKVASKDEIQARTLVPVEEESKEQKKHTQKLRQAIAPKELDEQEQLADKEGIAAKQRELRHKLGLTHITAKYSKMYEFKEERKFYEAQDDIAQRFERYLRLTDPVVEEVIREASREEIKEIEVRRKKEKQEESISELRRVSQFPKIEELRAMIKRDASELL